MNMKSMLKVAAVGAILAITSGLAACGGPAGSTKPVSGNWTDVVAAADDEGKVLLYSSQKPANLEALEAPSKRSTHESTWNSSAAQTPTSTRE